MLNKLSSYDATKVDILLVYKNKILETCTSNLLLIRNNKYYSPKNNCYIGNTISYLSKKLKIIFKDINLKDIHKYDEILLIGSGKGVTPVKFIKHYNEKMWMVDSVNEIDTFNWSPKGPSIASGKGKVFSDKISAYPIKLNGYDDYFPIATKDAKVLLNTEIQEYDLEKKTVKLNNEKISFDIIVNTLPPDIVFNFKLGKLPYIGRDFYPFILPIEHAFPKDVYFLYYPGKGKVTRCVEYKKLTKFKAKNTLIGLEVPSLSNRLYPLPIKKYQKLADDYFNLMPEGVYSAGRAGVYRYGIDFDRCIDHGMIIAKDLKSGGGGQGSVLNIDPTGEQKRVAK